MIDSKQEVFDLVCKHCYKEPITTLKIDTAMDRSL